MFRRSLNYLKITAQTLVRSSEILFKPGMTVLRQGAKSLGENLQELNSLPGAKFPIGELSGFGRELNQALPEVAKQVSMNTQKYSQSLANMIVETAKKVGTKAGILTENQNVKECIMEYLIQNLTEYAISLHVNNENKNYVGNYSDIKHIPVAANQPICMVSALLTPLVSRLLTLGIQNAHEIVQKVCITLVECKEKLSEQLYIADLDNYAYRLSSEEILAYCKGATSPNIDVEIGVKRDLLVQQYRDKSKVKKTKDLPEIEFLIDTAKLDNALKYSPF